jgi:hypothetical protein
MLSVVRIFYAERVNLKSIVTKASLAMFGRQKGFLLQVIASLNKIQ